jgi:hypothetical protein
VNERRNDLSVDGARPPNSSAIAPCCGRSMSSIESAPATRQPTFTPGVRTGLRRDHDVTADQGLQSGPLSQRHHRDQPAPRHEIRVVEGRGKSAADHATIASSKCPPELADRSFVFGCAVPVFRFPLSIPRGPDAQRIGVIASQSPTDHRHFDATGARRGWQRSEAVRICRAVTYEEASPRNCCR